MLKNKNDITNNIINGRENMSSKRIIYTEHGSFRGEIDSKEQLLSEEEQISAMRMYDVDFDDDSKYTIKIERTNKENLIVTLQEALNEKMCFCEKFDIEDLKDIDGYFYMFKNMEDIMEEFDQLFMENNVSIDNDYNNQLLLTFHIALNHGEKDIALRLLRSAEERETAKRKDYEDKHPIHAIGRKGKKDEDKKSELSEGKIPISEEHKKLLTGIQELINQQDKKLEELANKNSELREEVYRMNWKMTEHKQTMQIINQIAQFQRDNYKQMKKRRHKSDKSSSETTSGMPVKIEGKFDSSKTLNIKLTNEVLSLSRIIQHKKELNFLIDKINSMNSYKNLKVESIKRIYQASKDGSTADIFHQLCDGFSPIIVMVKTTYNRRFGGC